MTHALIGGVALALIALAEPAVADEASSRYQALVLPSRPPDQQVFIIDTKDGHIWRYWQHPGSPASEGVIYLGQIAPGTRSGEVIFRADQR